MDNRQWLASSAMSNEVFRSISWAILCGRMRSSKDAFIISVAKVPKHSSLPVTSQKGTRSESHEEVQISFKCFKDVFRLVSTVH